MKNPIIWADVPDPDVIRVNGWYYMSSTTMHYTPGVPIMRSRDLVHWETVSYVYDVLEKDGEYKLEEGNNVYGGGSWASSLRYRDGTFYVCFACNNSKKTYIYVTEDIERGPWRRHVFTDQYHDPSLIFDEGRAFIIYGAGSIRALELTPEASAVLPGATPVEIIRMGSAEDHVPGEGSHIYRIGDWYYLFIIHWPKHPAGPGLSAGRRIQWCFRSKDLLGRYEGKVVLDDDLGYFNNGVAQGGIFQSEDGRWFSMLFQDHGAVGRIPVLIPVEWRDGWPVFGQSGNVPLHMDDPLPPYPLENNLLKSDSFDSPEPGFQWQWNHNPDNSGWSLSERPGHLRIRAGAAVPDIHHARNTLTQRTFGPACSGEILLDASGLAPGDYAGIAAFQSAYGFIGVHADGGGKKSIVLCFNGENGTPVTQASVPFAGTMVRLKVICDFTGGRDSARFAYSTDGTSWTEFPQSLEMKYTLDHFTGYRFALFCYATHRAGGFADFAYFTSAIHTA